MKIAGGRRIMGMGMILGALVGCKPASVALGPFPATAPGHPGGLRYSLGRDMVVVEATIAEFIETRIVSGEDDRLIEETEAGVVPVGVQVSLKTTPDASSVYILDPGAGGWGDLSLDLRVGDNGLLASVEAEARSRAGETLIHIARIAGEVAGAAASFRGEAAPERTSGHAPTAAPTKRQRRLESLSPDALYFLQESASARDLGRIIDGLEDELSDLEDAYRGRAEAATTAAETARFSLAGKQADFIKDAIPFLQKRLTQAKEEFASALKIFAARNRLGRESRERAVRCHLDIPELPPSSVCHGEGGEEALIAALENNFPRALELYRETGLVIAFDPVPDLSRLPPPNRDDAPSPKAEIRVYYREPVPGFLRVFARRERLDRDKKEFDRMLLKVDEKPVLVLHPALPVRFVRLDRKAFSSRNLRVNVNGQGRVVGVSRATVSALAEAASGASSALAVILDQIAETLVRLEELIKR